MHSKKIALTAIVAALALGGTAYGWGGDRDGGHRGKGHGPMLEKIDTNGDGTVTKDEADAASAATFAEADANGDGNLTQDELVAFHQKKMEERKQARQDRMFSRLDADGDGTVSADEFAAKGDKRFERMDKNGDGSITPDEMKRGKHGKRGPRGGPDEGPDA